MDPQLPLTDADRQVAVAALRHHAGTGAIDLDAFGDRTAAVLAATTAADLDTVFADLPGGVPVLPSAAPALTPGPSVRPGAAVRASRPWPAARLLGRLAPVAPLAVLFVVIWAATGMGYFWPVWPILGTSIAAAKGGTCWGRRAHRRRPVWV